VDFFIVSQERKVYIATGGLNRVFKIRHRQLQLAPQRIFLDHLTAFFRFIPLAQVSLRGSMTRALGSDSSLHHALIEVFCNSSTVLSAGHTAPFFSAKNDKTRSHLTLPHVSDRPGRERIRK
jgi:hypothetical protein